MFNKLKDARLKRVRIQSRLQKPKATPSARVIRWAPFWLAMALWVAVVLIFQFLAGPDPHHDEAAARATAALVADHELRDADSVLAVFGITEGSLSMPLDARFTWVGRALLLLVALFICGGLLRISRPDLMASPSRIMLLILVTLLNILAISLLRYAAEQPGFPTALPVQYLLPLSFAPLLTTILIGPAAAIVAGVWTSFAAAILFEGSFAIFAMGLLVTIVSAYMAHDVRKRSRMVRIGLAIGGAQAIYGFSIALLIQLPTNLILIQTGVSLISGVVVALISLLFLPLFEALFDITTDITLLELSDMGHPLLQRLALEAPGTYHHSLMVSHLAQSAAREIGANAMLVRVCAYYHDIGKLTKPEFFVENTQFRENPHDDLTPSMSTLVIISHVKEGVGMARRAKLPGPIIEAIEQHHGTGLVAYFYHRAKQQKEGQGTAKQNGRDLSDADFRYPGPRPRTPEMGILLLADSVEAASRSMDKPTPSRIEHLVDDIVDSRLHDHQLDDCDLTFAQLTAIKRSFVFTLTNMLHGRVPYPKDEDRNKQSTVTDQVTYPSGEGVRSLDHATSERA